MANKDKWLIFQMVEVKQEPSLKTSPRGKIPLFPWRLLLYDYGKYAAMSFTVKCNSCLFLSHAGYNQDTNFGPGFRETWPQNA